MNPTSLGEKVEDEHERVQQEQPDLEDDMHQYVVERTVWRTLCEYLLTFNIRSCIFTEVSKILTSMAIQFHASLESSQPLNPRQLGHKMPHHNHKILRM